jgi:hypothetical protein
VSAATAVAATGGAWMAAASDALAIVAETSLGGPVSWRGDAPGPREATLAAYVPILAPDGALHVGVVVDGAAGRELARALLQEPSGDGLTPTDVADALGEIANMVAGAAKASMSSAMGLVALGLPLIVHGCIAPSADTAIECARAEVAGVPLTLVVMQSRATR